MDMIKRSERNRIVLWRGIKILEPYSNGELFILHTILLVLGLILGSFILLSHSEQLLQTKISPMLFSGIPNPNLGLFSSFSTILLNQFIFLILLFLSGVTAFGSFAVPFLIFLRGVTIGTGCSYFLLSGGLSGLIMASIIFIPTTVFACFFQILFASRAFIFSRQLTRQVFNAEETVKLSFNDYVKTFSPFLVASVFCATIGTLHVFVYSLFR